MISSKGHEYVMRNIQKVSYEYQVESLFLEFVSN